LNKFGIKSSSYKKFAANWKEALLLAEQKIDLVVEKRNAGTLVTKEEADSYPNQAMDHQIAKADKKN
jgi:hypothetical protein